MLLTKAEELALLTIARRLNRVLQGDDAVSLGSKGLVEQNHDGSFRLTARGQKRVDRVRP